MNAVVSWTVGCWIALCVAFGATARADDPLAKPKDAVARDYLQQGSKLYYARELEKAIDAYKAAPCANKHRCSSTTSASATAGSASTRTRSGTTNRTMWARTK